MLKTNSVIFPTLVISTALVLFSCSTHSDINVTPRAPASVVTEDRDIFVGWNDDTHVLASDSLFLFSFGKTAGVITAKVDARSAVAVEILESGQSVAKAGPQLGQISLTLALPSQGRFRISFQGAVTTSRDVMLSTQCLGDCGHKAIPASVFAKAVKANGQLPALEKILMTKVSELVPDPLLQAQLATELHGILMNSDYDKLDHFPVIPLRQTSKLRSAIGGMMGRKSTPNAAPAVVTGRLEDLLGSCSTAPELPAPLSADMPGLGYGHFPNMGMSPCELDRSVKLAQIMTSLVANNQSAVDYNNEHITTPKDLVTALIQSGHSVEMRNERTYANFISLAYGDSDITWPVWLDTGVKTPNTNRNLVIPMGHSQHAFRIRGPLVNARVTFFLGTGGVGFFAQTDVRPLWTGMRAAYVKDSTKPGDQDVIFKALDAAHAYYARIQTEKTSLARGLPADGYGYVGVCNDSTALLEFMSMKTVTEFPLMRAKSLESQPDLGDGIDEALRKLPKDGDVAPTRSNLYQRVLSMTPYGLESPYFPNEELRSMMKEVSSSRGR